jgi:hypothetical protein
LVKGPRRPFPLDWLTRGSSPVSPTNFSGDEKRSITPISAAIVNARTQPIPGTVRSSGR